MSTDNVAYSLENVAFGGLIQARAEALGRAPSQSNVETLEEVLKSLVRHDAEANVLTVYQAEGEAVDLFAYIDAAVAKFPAKPAPEPEPEPVAADGWVKVSIGNSTGWRKANDPMLKIMQGFQASDDAALAREITAWGNPWGAGHENRTRQTIIQNKDPAFAAKLKAQAAA